MLGKWLQGKRHRVVLAYVLLQFVIWAKCLVFFSLFGHGKVGDFSVAEFPMWVILPDWFFHEAMHVGIGILALLYGRSLANVKWKSFWLAVFSAVALHNFAYWLTASHPSALYSAVDFVSDSVLLAAFVLAGFVFLNRNNRFKLLKSFRLIAWTKKKSS